MDGRSVLVVGALGAVVVGVLFVLSGATPRTEAVARPTFSVASATASVPVEPGSPAGVSTAGAQLVVHVAGLVARPGVYELPPGSRVVDAVEAAGGAIAGTDLSQLNLARMVVDGEQVAVGVPPAPGGGVGSGTPGTESSSPLDLNLATETQLDSLPGVGPVLAARIVAWRQANGRFSSVEELLEVSGIGEATLGDIAPLVRV